MFIIDIDKVERIFITEVSACFTMLEQRIAVSAKSSTGDGEGWAGPASITIPLLAANGDVKPDTDN